MSNLLDEDEKDHGGGHTIQLKANSIFIHEEMKMFTEAVSLYASKVQHEASILNTAFFLYQLKKDPLLSTMDTIKDLQPFMKGILRLVAQGKVEKGSTLPQKVIDFFNTEFSKFKRPSLVPPKNYPSADSHIFNAMAQQHLA
jgi:hypothetical protein